jgi:Rad3-related DNA helicase
MDEAHEIETHIVNFIESDIDPKELYESHGIGANLVFKKDTVLDSLYELLEEVEDRIDAVNDVIQSANGDLKIKDRVSARKISSKELDKIKKLNSRLAALNNISQRLKIFFSTIENPDDWIINVNEQENTVLLSPLRAGKLFETYIGAYAKKRIFMSATIGDYESFITELGLDKTKTLLVETDTPFKADMSPVVFIPSGKLSYKDLDKSLPGVLSKVSSIAQEHGADKGIIHSGNYKIAQYIIENASKDLKDRLIARDLSSTKLNNTNLIKKHFDTDEPTILLSPSMMTGIDLADDAARFQIIIKLPFGSLGDPRIKKKSEVFDSWYMNDMFIKILQASGRATRNEEDYSITYILDSSFGYFYNSFKPKLPKWFKDRVVFI